jgi:predicted  nucleic acid-binding Zn-ribbon protein
MSTAGKVLVVLVMITSLVWIVLASGLAQLNANGNRRLNQLTTEIEKLKDQVEKAQNDVASLRDQAASVQEQADRDRIVLRARQSDIEKSRSQIKDALERVQYQVATVQDTIKSSEEALLHRNEEYQSEEKALADLKSEVQTLMADTGQLLERLTSLRKQFQDKYHANVEMLGKTH